MANERRREEQQIAELKKGLEGAQAEISSLKDRLAAAVAIEGDVAKLKEQIAERDKTISALKTELEQARAFLRTTDRKTIDGLDPSRSAQLATSVKIPLQDGRAAFADGGDVVACGDAEKDIDSIRKRVGTACRVHHVTRAVFDELVAKQQIRV